MGSKLEYEGGLYYFMSRVNDGQDIYSFSPEYPAACPSGVEIPPSRGCREPHFKAMAFSGHIS